MIDAFVIYDHPKDFPDCFVVRRWIFSRWCRWPTGAYASAHTLEEARAMIPAGCERVQRDADDDPVIVEIWL